MIPEVVAEQIRGGRIVVLTGAGVSAESGIPTFRGGGGDDGFWGQYDPMQLATPEGFEVDPALVTRWYDWRRGQLSGVEPNPGHHALAELEWEVKAGGGSFTLLTQNVDGLHHRAGSEGVVELHGSLQRWRCTRCGAEGAPAPEPFRTYPPPCGRGACDGILRPCVVWFGEMLPVGVMDAAAAALTGCDLFMSVGTSGEVYPVNSLIDVAREQQAITIEVNPERTPASDLFDLSIRGRSGEVLPALVRAVLGGDG